MLQATEKGLEDRTIEQIDGKILLNPGPSPKSFHRVMTAAFCLQKYALRYVAGNDGKVSVPLEPSAPLVRGGLAHTGLAHFYAMRRAREQGADPNQYHEPLEAIRLDAELRKEQLGSEHHKLIEAARDMVIPAVQAYMERHSMEKMKTIIVEEIMEFSIGPYEYTHRLDWVYEQKGYYYIADHKTSNANSLEGAADRYQTDLQFLMDQYVGKQKWGDKFGGVVVNVLGLRDAPYKTFRQKITPAPALVARFPRIVADLERQIAQYTAEGRDIFDWPPAVRETVCVTSYGPCEMREKCKWGSAVARKPSDLVVVFT